LPVWQWKVYLAPKTGITTTNSYPAQGTVRVLMVTVEGGPAGVHPSGVTSARHLGLTAPWAGLNTPVRLPGLGAVAGDHAGRLQPVSQVIGLLATDLKAAVVSVLVSFTAVRRCSSGALGLVRRPGGQGRTCVDAVQRTC
jgi:hypothetical protein